MRHLPLAQRFIALSRTLKSVRNAIFWERKRFHTCCRVVKCVGFKFRSFGFVGSTPTACTFFFPLHTLILVPFSHLFPLLFRFSLVQNVLQCATCIRSSVVLFCFGAGEVKKVVLHIEQAIQKAKYMRISIEALTTFLRAGSVEHSSSSSLGGGCSLDRYTRTSKRRAPRHTSFICPHKSSPL